MHRLRTLFVVLAAVAMSFTGLTTASAEGPRPPEIRWLGPGAWTSSIDPENIIVKGSYRCWGPPNQFHLWVSVKQGGPDPTAEGSSSTVRAWYDTNMSGDDDVRCNGQWQNVMVELAPWETDFTGRPLGHLRNGGAYMQFCLVQGEDFIASRNRWIKVQGYNYRPN